MKKLSAHTALIILGIVIFLLGCIQPARYEKAIENGYEVEAVVVDIKVRKNSGPDESDEYTYYVDYTFEGKKYTHVKFERVYADKYHKGETVSMVIDPLSPGRAMFEGGILATAGFLITVIGIIKKVKSKKANKQQLN